MSHLPHLSPQPLHLLAHLWLHLHLLHLWLRLHLHLHLPLHPHPHPHLLLHQHPRPWLWRPLRLGPGQPWLPRPVLCHHQRLCGRGPLQPCRPPWPLWLRPRQQGPLPHPWLLLLLGLLEPPLARLPLPRRAPQSPELRHQGPRRVPRQPML